MNYEFLNGDCIELLKDLPSHSVNTIFGDPPFNIGKAYSSYDDSKDYKDYIYMQMLWIHEAIRLLKHDGSLFFTNLPRQAIDLANLTLREAHLRSWIVWNSPANDKRSGHFPILWFTKTEEPKVYKCRYPHLRDKYNQILADYGGKANTINDFGPVVTDVWSDIPRVFFNRADHPCQLPVSLVERAILMTTDAGDTVLDPFMGTGTTGIAARHLGRKFIGIDLDKDYVRLAKVNVARAEATRLGNAYVSIHRKKVRTVREIDLPEISKFLKTAYFYLGSDRDNRTLLPDV